MILIAAGGSGGHLLPAQQLAEILIEKGHTNLLFAGHKLKESPYFDRHRFRYAEVVSAAPQKGVFRFLRAMIRGFCHAFYLCLKEKPAVVVGFGSYHTVPVLLAALLTGRKIVLYEANHILGKVNRLFAPFAKGVAAPFPVPCKRRISIAPFPWKGREKRGAEAFASGLERGRFTLLVFGGSQGAAFLNEMAPYVAARFGAQVIHLAGNEKAAEEVRLQYKALGVSAVVKGFEENMGSVYEAADFAICRSGAGTIGELIHYQLPALLIPFPLATDDHQRHNAEYLAKKGGASILLQKEATLDAMVKALESAKRESIREVLRGLKERSSIGLYEVVAQMVRS
jgi:UDP-N-acetylglucosamine--N-acetylmuramyl-(pentapeptide) pyrophosphoryl-undecaprenol N-acetylglucosamine transferase